MFKGRASSLDIIGALVLLLGAYLVASYFDLFELLHGITRDHEEWELDEIILLVLVAPIPLSWIVYREQKAIGREIARREQVEDALARTDKMKALGVMAGGVAHEINNQLLPILTMSELVRDRMNDDNPDRRKLELILNAAQNARDTVEKILSFSRQDYATRETGDLAPVWEKLGPMLAIVCPSNIKLSLDVEECRGTVGISETDLQGILVNLVTNSIYAIGNKAGTITLDASNCTTGSDNKMLAMISVRDTGPGIEAKSVSKVFDPFFTTKPPGEGLGLGLSIAYALVEKAGGHIALHTDVGEGCQFDIILPVQSVTDERQVEMRENQTN